MPSIDPMTHHLVALLTLALVGACGDDGAPAAPTSTSAPGSSTSGDPTTSEENSGPPPLVCEPGEVRCSGQEFLETCAPTGLEWVAEACPDNSFCDPCDTVTGICAADLCVGPCEIAADLPSSAGCSFIANRQLHPYETWDDGIIVGNPSTELSATVNIFKIPEGKRKEEAIDGFPVTLAPGDAFPYRINTSFISGFDSLFRTGGMFRIESDIPVIAYQHSPFENNRGNDSSLLLPENVLGRDYVVVSYNPSPTANLPQAGLPSYFEIIALFDGTTVEWTPPVATQGNGLPIGFVAAGETGSIGMNRFDTMRITASDGDPDVRPEHRDVSGTVIHADQPIWVVGATKCGAVPVTEDYAGSTCDPLQELLLPLEHWGTTYVAIAPPKRNDEWSHWRIYGGREGVTVESDPPLPEFPYTFGKPGEYIDVHVGPDTPFVLQSSGGAFLPVLQLQSLIADVWTDPEQTSISPYMGTDASNGDAAMVQMVPAEQFLARYVFMTGVGFGQNWAVFIREQGSADVRLDGVTVTDWEPVGTFEQARVPVINSVEDGTDSHFARSDDPFGLIQIGYSSNVMQGQPGADGCIDALPPGLFCSSAYAYPGGMKSEEIFIP